MKSVSNRRADIGRLSAHERDTGATLYPVDRARDG